MLAPFIFVYLSNVFLPAASHYVDYTHHEVTSVWYNKTCIHDDHCNDFRLVCRDNYCVCCQFHTWDQDSKQCVLHSDELQIWLAQLGEERDYSAELTREAQKTFFHIGLSGALSASLAFLGILACICILCLSRILKEEEDSESLVQPRNESWQEDMRKDGDGGLSHVALDFVQP